MSNGRPDHQRPGDDGVDQAWRSASNEMPGSRLDAAILDAAQAEVSRDQLQPGDSGGGTTVSRRRYRWSAWQPLAAAATVAGLAFVLVQTMPRDRDVAPPIAVEQARPEAVAPAEVESRIADENRATAGTVPVPPAADTGASPLETTAEVMEAPAAELPAEPTAESPAVAAAESRDEQAMRSRAAAPAPAPAPAPASAGMAAQGERELGESQQAMKSAASALTPEAWATRVEQFFSAGDRQAAAAELRAFRAAHADADQFLPQELRDWAGTVR